MTGSGLGNIYIFRRIDVTPNAMIFTKSPFFRLLEKLLQGAAGVYNPFEPGMTDGNEIGPFDVGPDSIRGKCERYAPRRYHERAQVIGFELLQLSVQYPASLLFSKVSDAIIGQDFNIVRLGGKQIGQAQKQRLSVFDPVIGGHVERITVGSARI